MPDSEQTTQDTVLASNIPDADTAPTAGDISPRIAETEWNGDLTSLFPGAHQASENRPIPPALHQMQGDAGSSGDVTPDALSEPARLAQTHELNQSLARLEMNSHQVRLYLDSIEEKISRMEPRLEQMRDLQQPTPSPAQPPIQPLTPSLDQIPSQPLDQPPLSGQPADPPAQQAATPPSPAESAPERRRPSFDLPSTPVRSFASRLNSPLPGNRALLHEEPWSLRQWLLSRRRQLTVAAVILIAFVTILSFSTGRRLRPASSQTPAANTPATVSGESTTHTPSANLKASAGTPLSEPQTSSSAAGAEPHPASASLVPAGAASVVTSNLTGANSGSTASTSVSSALSTGPPDDRRDPAPANTPSTPRLIPPSGRVRVSSGVMAGNLLSSRTPRYPGGLASLFHTQGKVTLQAIIARDGKVENLRVLSGHRLLRGAAQDAVRTWRYRPYLIGGIPVEVATIITVEFHR